MKTPPVVFINMQKKGLTLLEIIISTAIFALVILGLSNIFVASKRYILHSRARMAGAELGKYFLDPLQMNVRQDTWDQAGNNLSVGTYSASQLVNNINYNSTYLVSNVTGTTIRRAVLNLTWNETSP